MNTIDHVLFDLGGVLVDFRGISSLADRLGRPHAVMAEAWLASPAVRAYERGQIDTASFVEQIRAELNMDMSVDEFRVEMAGWLPGLLPGARELAQELGEQGTAISCLSNTNDLHWGRMQGWGIGDWFEHRVLSHEIGMVKPDAEIFEHACVILGSAPAQVLYFDDHPTNVEAARRSGLKAEQATGPAEARRHLVRAGLLA